MHDVGLVLIGQACLLGNVSSPLVCLRFCACCLQIANLVLTILFTLEMLTKHLALGLLGYWSSGFNVLDGLIVVASLVDLGLQYSGHSHRLHSSGAHSCGMTHCSNNNVLVPKAAPSASDSVLARHPAA